MRRLYFLVTVFLVLMISMTAFASGKVYILCYHTFLGKSKICTDFSIPEFRAQMITLQQEGFRFVQWKEVLQNRVQGSKNILVMIDDGNISTNAAYHRVLKPLGIKPMLALYPGILNTRKFALTWSQIKVMQQDGCEVASHGYFHEYFTQKFHDEHPKDFDNEFYLSKSILESRLGLKINEIVYPFGISSDIATQTLKSAGYRYGFSLRQSPLSVPIPPAEALDLPRYMVTRGQGATAIFGMLSRVAKGSQ